MAQTIIPRPVNGCSQWLRLTLLGGALGLMLPGQALPHTAAKAVQGPTGGYLLRKAETLEAAGQYDAAVAVYNQAAAAFRQANDRDGQQRALTQLATMEEKRADQLLAGLAPPQHTATPAVARAAAPVAIPPARPAATPPPCSRPGSAAGPNGGRQAGGAVLFHERLQ